ncbi:uncharacterized protein MYCFIDRAFT_173622 [Pseudocercospora fijiensis CIRAD86]|uniref:CARD domain-containing protein n=1 Tax=Pseudocercospora fijiensis (strain CIRAD86) TaxID=383855 RepID=M3B5Q4_PSEFD|nr:uncharacterized protein MYCFIDRAFT_173622 [Pseudocercospora fijiensis CIRAD86]EME84678.1 hypothetical protein MYCFIDRAFT_173622 [Pseudocercospora fijiensis CIRAD86]
MNVDVHGLRLAGWGWNLGGFFGSALSLDRGYSFIAPHHSRSTNLEVVNRIRPKEQRFGKERFSTHHLSTTIAMASGDKKIKVLLFGLGAIGGFYAFVLGKNDNVSLSVVARSNYDAIKRDGLTIESDNHGKHKASIDHVFKSPSDADFKFDYIVCAHKAIKPASFPPLFKSVADQKTTFVIIQNGVGNEEPFREVFPSSTIISCVCWTGATQHKSGIITHSTNERLEMGLYPNPTIDSALEQKRLDGFASLLKAGNSPFSIEENIQIKRWEKVVWNVAWNPLTTLTGLQVQKWLKTSPEAMTFTRNLMEDVIKVARRLDVPLKDGLAEDLINRVLPMPLIFSSMYVDAKEGRPLEIDVIVGFPMKKAKEFGMDVPALTAVYALTSAVNARLEEAQAQASRREADRHVMMRDRRRRGLLPMKMESHGRASSLSQRGRNRIEASASAPPFSVLFCSFITTSALRTFLPPVLLSSCKTSAPVSEFGPATATWTGTGTFSTGRRRTAAGHIITMAFQAAPEMLPVMVEAMRVSLRSIGSAAAAAARTEKKAVSKSETHTDAEAKQVPVRQRQRAEMPEYMSTAPLGALRHQMPSASALQPSFSTASILSAMPRGTLRYASPLTRTFSSLTPLARSFSTTTRFGPLTLRAPSKTTFVGFSQQRTLFGSSWASNMNRNLLAHLEQTANNNPGSATAQNAFYQALLRANMPEIVVERYQTGRYATNPAIDQTYTKALERVGAAELGGSGLGAMMGRTPAGNSHNLSNEQLQAIGQAASMKATGGNVSISKQGSGSKSEPLYVVVDESTSSTIFKWVKFFFVFGLVAYCALVVFTLLIEATGMLKRASAAQIAEAKPELQTTKFTDVHGCDEAKEELQELVEFLKAPQRFSTLGGKLPKGVLLVGPPGTGKTLLARAVAGEAGVPFFYMSGSEFDEVYVGVGSRRVRELFAAARAKSPAIVFIDELDAIGGKRHERDVAYAKQTLNQLLTELDGFDQTSCVIVIGATNFPQSLDKALTRPGRFDRNIQVPLPDVRGRIAILKHHMRNMKIDASVDLAVLARGCPGLSGAELENVVNQAAIRASKNMQQKITIKDLEWAKDKILMGAELKSFVIQEKDKLMTAYHEGGHALVCMLTEGAMPLYKATIMPRGHTLGTTTMLPELDEISQSKKQLLASIDISMGGKVAEELVYGPNNVTTGASNDISNATRVAYHMVTQAGMSDLLGNIDLADNYAELSTKTKEQIEDEVRRIVEEGRQRAVKLLTTNREALDRLAKALVEYETLTREEMEMVVRGEKLPDKIISADVSAPVKAPAAAEPKANVMPSPVGGSTGSFGAPPGPAGDAGVAASTIEQISSLLALSSDTLAHSIDGVRSTDAMMDEDQNWTPNIRTIGSSICVCIYEYSFQKASLLSVFAFHLRHPCYGGSKYISCMIVHARIKASCYQSACTRNKALSLGVMVV